MTRSRLREDARLVRLDRRLATPLFRQVYQRIRDAILDGTLPPGASLPSSRSLAAQLSTARGTIELAYTLSAGEDYILARTASGTASVRTFPPSAGASISDGPASAGCVTSKA